MAVLVAKIVESELWGSWSIQKNLRLSYRVGTTHNDDVTRDPFIVPASGDRRLNASDRGSCEPFPEEWIPSVNGTWANPSINSLPAAACGHTYYTYGDIYFRIWTIPTLLQVANAELLVDYPFIVWNAYNSSNTLNSIGGSGQTGLTLDLSAPDTFNPVEELEVNLQIGTLAPNIISATYLFNFTDGIGTFIFETIVLDWIKTIPEIPVIETWETKTDIMTAFNSTEQRVSARRQPRRKQEYNLLLDDDIERQREYDRWYMQLSEDIVLPFYQYSTRITQDSAISTSKIFFDPDKTDVRSAEYVIIFRPSTDDSFVLQLGTVVSDGSSTDSPLSQNILTGDLVCPAATSRLENLTGPEMTSVSGNISISAWATEFRTAFNKTRYVDPVSIETYDSLNILDKCPLARSSAQESFDIDPTIFDFETGLHEQRSSWDHAFVTGSRMFLIQRKRFPEDMDWWRDFIVEANGQRDSFLLPSWREDLILDSNPSQGATLIYVEGTSYGLNYWPHDTYKRLKFTINKDSTDEEIIYRKIDAIESIAGGTTKLTLDTALPGTSQWGNGFIIEFLNKCRFGSDIFKLTHYALYSIIEVTIRTTDQ